MSRNEGNEFYPSDELLPPIQSIVIRHKKRHFEEVVAKSQQDEHVGTLLGSEKELALQEEEESDDLGLLAEVPCDDDLDPTTLDLASDTVPPPSQLAVETPTITEDTTEIEITKDECPSDQVAAPPKRLQHFRSCVKFFF